MDDPERIRMLKVLTSFTLGSVIGLVTLSHLLNYVLKHFKKHNIIYHHGLYYWLSWCCLALEKNYL